MAFAKSGKGYNAKGKRLGKMGWIAPACLGGIVEISLFKDLSPENPEIMNNKHFYNSDNLIKKDNENNFEHKTIKKESNDSIPTINLVTNLYHDENDECEEGLLSPIHSDLPNGYL